MKLVVLAFVLAGCLIKPDRVTGDGGTTTGDGHGGADGGGSGSGSGGELQARVLSAAFFDGTGGSSDHQNATNWELATGDLQPGELVILIGNIDGDVTLTGLDSNFDLVVQQRFGPNAGQTYLAFTKTATTEPATYGGSFGTASTTGYAALALVAVRNAAQAMPVWAHNHDLCTMTCNPGPLVKLMADPVTTHANNSLILFAGGADWLAPSGHALFDPPSPMTTLLRLTDEGTATSFTFQKSTLLLATTIQSNAGMSAAYAGATTNELGSGGGLPWTITLGVAPR